MAGRFSTAKRSKEATSEAVSKIGDAFASGAEAAEKQSRWKSFINSKPIQGICAGSKTFGKFVAAKTASAAKWTGTKLKDAGHDFGQGAKAFGHSFAESYHTRQEEKRTAKFIKGCEERGFVVMAQDEFQSAYKSMSDMYKALYPEGPKRDAVDIFAHVNAGEAISKMRDRIVHFNAANGIEDEPAAFTPTSAKPTMPSIDVSMPVDDIAAKVEAEEAARAAKAETEASTKNMPKKDPATIIPQPSDAESSPAAAMKGDIRDAAENGVKSDKLSTKLSQACASLDDRIAQIRESLDRIGQAQTEEEKSQIASDCIRELRNHIVGMGNKLNEDVHDIDASKSESSKADRGNEFDFAETEDESKDAAVDYDGV